jgi:hypothetical protein
MSGRVERPLQLFGQDLKAQYHTDAWADFGRELAWRWNALTGEERFAYEAKSEALRLEAWVDFENSEHKRWW